MGYTTPVASRSPKKRGLKWTVQPLGLRVPTVGRIHMGSIALGAVLVRIGRVLGKGMEEQFYGNFVGLLQELRVFLPVGEDWNFVLGAPHSEGENWPSLKCIPLLPKKYFPKPQISSNPPPPRNIPPLNVPKKAQCLTPHPTHLECTNPLKEDQKIRPPKMPPRAVLVKQWGWGWFCIMISTTTSMSSPLPLHTTVFHTFFSKGTKPYAFTCLCTFPLHQPYVYEKVMCPSCSFSDSRALMLSHPGPKNPCSNSPLSICSVGLVPLQN